MTIHKTTSLWIVAFLVMATIPYSMLISEFGYDDILRAPPQDILQKFHDGGDRLIWTWLAFAISALMFIPVAIGMEKITRKSGDSSYALASIAIASAVAQATGLLR